MSDFEKYFFDTLDFFEKEGIKVFVHGSTLLRIIRNKTVDPRPGVTGDRELNFGILDEDFKGVVEKIKKSYPYVVFCNNSQHDKALVYFSKFTKDDIWDHPYFILLSRYYPHKDSYVEYMGANEVLLYPQELFKFGHIQFKKRKIPTFANPKDWLTTYFGDNWREELPGWGWGNSKCFVNAKELG